MGANASWDAPGHTEFIEHIRGWAHEFIRVLAHDGIGFAFCNDKYTSYWWDLLEEAGASQGVKVHVELAIWCKPDAAWRKDFVAPEANDAFKKQVQMLRHSTEMVLLFRKQTIEEPFTKVLENVEGVEAEANVWKINKCSGEERLQ
ncbi:hypothetical protein CYMTET_9576, partial [Cymbomonas tetramitiformis]